MAITQRFATEDYVKTPPIELLQTIYPVGTVYVSSTNTSPSSLFGGTWKLVDKTFATQTGSGSSEYITLTDNASNCTISYSRAGHNLKIKILIKTAIEIEDDTVTLGVINFEALGVTGIPYDLGNVVGGSDGGEAAVFITIKDSTKELNTVEVIHHSGGTMEANSNCYLYIDVPTNYTYMIDSFCDQFYWKRIA